MPGMWGAVTDLRGRAGDPAVSVIMPAYNTAQFIGPALRSVEAQAFTDYEVVVVNDGSPDTEQLEAALAPHRGRIRYLRLEANRGLSEARNLAIGASRGRYLAFLDSDDMWEPDYLGVQVAALERDPTIDVIYGDALIIGESPHAGKRYMEVCPSEGGVTFARLVRQECNVLSSATARRAAVVRAGLFDVSLGSSEDFDLWLRVVLQGGRIGYHRQVLSRYRRRDGSLSSDALRMWGSFLAVLEKVKRTAALAPKDLEAVEQQCARIRAMLRLCRGKEALSRGDVRAALGHLREANSFLKSRKISLALGMLRLSPSLTLRAYRLRQC